MKKFILSIFIVLFFSNKTNAQLLLEGALYPNAEREFYSNVKTIKKKSYSGTGGAGFWSITRLDSLGRVIEKEYHRKKRLLSKRKFVYNSNNDVLYQIITFDINNPSITNDTVSCYEYKYQGNRIFYQKLTFCGSTNDSVVTYLIDSDLDTFFVYQEKSYYFRPRTNDTDIYEEKYTLNCRNGRLVTLGVVDEDRKATTFLEYYYDGKLKRIKTERDPEEEFVMVGGPGGDDMLYEYKLDRHGRIKTIYYIIKEKRYKIATYQYK